MKVAGYTGPQLVHARCPRPDLAGQRRHSAPDQQLLLPRAVAGVRDAQEDRLMRKWCGKSRRISTSPASFPMSARSTPAPGPEQERQRPFSSGRRADRTGAEYVNAPISAEGPGKENSKSRRSHRAHARRSASACTTGVAVTATTGSRHSRQFAGKAQNDETELSQRIL